MIEPVILFFLYQAQILISHIVLLRGSLLLGEGVPGRYEIQ